MPLLSSSSAIVMIINPGEMIWAGHVAHMGGVRNIQRIRRLYGLYPPQRSFPFV
jgi:hypothetical protein